MIVGQASDHPSPGRTVEKSDLDQIRFIDIFDGVFFFTDGRRNGVDADRATPKFFDDRQEQLTIDLIESETIDIGQIQTVTGDLEIDAALGPHLGEIQHTTHETVGDARRAATPEGNFQVSLLVDLHTQNAC